MPRLKQPRAAGEAVTATALGKHLDLTIQRIKQLANEGVIEQLSTGRYDQDACRIAYLRWLRAPERRIAKSQYLFIHFRRNAMLALHRSGSRPSALYPREQSERGRIRPLAATMSYQV